MIEAGRYIVVGDYGDDPAVVQVIEVEPNGVVLLRLLHGHGEAHVSLLEPDLPDL